MSVKKVVNTMSSFTDKVNREIKKYKEDTGNSVEDLSDGYHTFGDLYHHRAVLFSVICNANKELAWKSKQHFDPKDEMYEDMFIVGITTPKGTATYHYNINPYWDMFHVQELERAPEWDGSTPEQDIERIASLSK